MQAGKEGERWKEGSIPCCKARDQHLTMTNSSCLLIMSLLTPSLTPSVSHPSLLPPTLSLPHRLTEKLNCANDKVEDSNGDFDVLGLKAKEIEENLGLHQRLSGQDRTGKKTKEHEGQNEGGQGGGRKGRMKAGREGERKEQDGQDRDGEGKHQNHHHKAEA